MQATPVRPYALQFRRFRLIVVERGIDALELSVVRKALSNSEVGELIVGGQAPIQALHGASSWSARVESWLVKGGAWSDSHRIGSSHARQLQA